jgi:trehalose 6-phosphate synthase/phosphatase
MNLVCQEYVTSQRDPNAVLVLSEFAGAAHQLEGAVQVNPWNADQMADALHESLEMPLEERHARLDQMRAAVEANTSSDWAGKFIDTLKRHTRTRERRIEQELTDDQLEALHAEWEKASERFVLLDYAAIANSVEGAPTGGSVDGEFMEVLLRIASQANVYVISDAPKSELEQTLGALPVGLCVDRGYLLKPRGEQTWRELVEFPLDWMNDVLPVMEVLGATTPGAVVDKKGVSLRWNWQGCEPGFGSWQANELAACLNESLANLPLEVVHEYRSIQVRPLGVNQGALSRYVAAQANEDVCILAVGDECTDEAFFAELPKDAWTCRVGQETKKARFLLGCCSDVAALLNGLATATGKRFKEPRTSYSLGSAD